MNEKLRVVIVEDDCLIAMDLSELLAGEGHEVCAIAATEDAAVAAARQHVPDVMIVDAHLREGSGIAAMQQILAAGFIPHVYVSGDRRGVSGLVPGAIVIDKPFAMHALLAAIEQARAHGDAGLVRVGAA